MRAYSAAIVRGFSLALPRQHDKLDIFFDMYKHNETIVYKGVKWFYLTANHRLHMTPQIINAVNQFNCIIVLDK